MSFSFLCLNLWYGGKLWDPLITFLREMQPDILAAQEVYGGTDAALPNQYQTIERFRTELGYPHIFFSPSYGEVTPYVTIPLGNAIFSRFPLQHTETVFYDVPFNPTRDEQKEAPDFSRTPRNLQHAVVDIGAGAPNLHIFNTQGIWGFDGEDNPRRRAMSTRMMETVNGHTPAVLCGDFNVREGTETIATIDQKLHSVFRGTVRTTFNMKYKPSTFTPQVVDMVFVSPDIQVEQFSVPDADVTDHVPLFCRFRIGS